VSERPHRHTARWAALGALVVGVGLTAVLATRPSASATEVDTPLLGHVAPPVVGTTLVGAPFDLRAYRGRWVVLNFFASWCPPCQQEQPDLVTFAYRHRGADQPALVGVVYDDSASAARGFLKSTGGTWPALGDPNGQIALSYGVRGPPETFLISPSQIVAAHFDGPITAGELDYWLGRAQETAA
jgi:cytochrome c biogenesis protein CcmG, thiol:disulfide interchange protein DsbE